MYKIRRAQNNYTCEYCKGVIHTNETYYDYSVKNKDDKYEHFRYHSCCFEKNNRKDIISLIWKMLNDEGPVQIAFQDGTKSYICGICFDRSNNKYFHLKTWNEHISYFLTLKDLREKKAHFVNGDLI